MLNLALWGAVAAIAVLFVAAVYGRRGGNTGIQEWMLRVEGLTGLCSDYLELIEQVITPPAKAGGFSEAEATNPPTASTAASRATLAATRYVSARRPDPGRCVAPFEEHPNCFTRLRFRSRNPQQFLLFRCAARRQNWPAEAAISTSVPQTAIFHNRKPCPALPPPAKAGGPRAGVTPY